MTKEVGLLTLAWWRPNPVAVTALPVAGLCTGISNGAPAKITSSFKHFHLQHICLGP